MSLSDITLNEERFIGLLRNLISETEFLQNNPPSQIPQEDRAIRHILDVLKPFSKENGGPIEIDHINFTEGRGNLILKYAGTTDKVVSLVGSHLDVVPANPEGWERNPFELKIEGDRLYGRGTTDCLGHVALITTLFSQLAELNIKLDITLYAVFIASEEADGPGVGIDGLMAAGKLDALKQGPVLWVDCSDSQPCIGTAGSLQWHLKSSGKLFHSGLPHKAINPIELGIDALRYVQDRFYEEFPAHPNEAVWRFATPSTIKPTQIGCPKGGLNQIPGSSVISGDIRLTPFYKIADAKSAVERFVNEFNEKIHSFQGRGPCSKYVLPDEERTGKVELLWNDSPMSGIACNIESVGFKALCKAIEPFFEVKPYSICGSLPLVHEMQEAGFDIQLIGFGLSSTYHADNEYCELSSMKNAIQILTQFVHHVAQM